MNSFFSKVQQYYYEILKILVFIIAIGLVSWLSPKDSIFKYEFQIGSPWKHNDLFAPFDFAILKTKDQIAQEKEKVLQGFQPFFNYDNNIANENLKVLESNFVTLWHSDLKSGRKRTKDSLKCLKFTKELYSEVENKGIIRTDDIIEGKPSDYRIKLIKDNLATNAKLGDFYTIKGALEYVQSQIRKANRADSSIVLGAISHALVQNVFYDKSKSETAQQELINHISPAFGMMQKGEMIISKGELVTPKKNQILLSLKKMYETEYGSSNHKYYVLLGITLLITLLFLLEYLFLRFYKFEFFNELKYINLILLTQVALVALAFYIFKEFPEYVYAIPFVILPIILIAFIDHGTAIVVYLITVMLIGFFAPNSFEFFYTQFAAGLVAVFSIGKWDHRIQIARTSLLTFLTYLIVYISMLYSREGNLNSFSLDFIKLTAANSVLLFLAFPIVFFYEKLFGLVTKLTLLELSNTNNTLLRELSVKAPGTFQHSLQVSNLAAEALYEIDGDTLLARTGALYHDIGKMNNPTYFIENLSSGFNPHDELSYEESARIIIAHVLDGIEMARKAKVPEQVIDFIRTHHGTRMVEYFYRLEKKKNPGLEIDSSEFRYHGPIPFSKETAVVMMADSVEAASRSISNPNEQKINDLVENIVNALIEDNQFANANITFKEITKVKKVLKKKLLNINHVRIAYPD
ncbi:MAG: phosphohydrolase [Bacteroidetes bacterium]|nr:MAG: phosphohydrolase [Bacteroidota bacterium]